MEIYPEKERLEAVKVTDLRGNTVLHYAAQNPNPESLRTILELLPEKDHIEAVKVKDPYGHRVLHYAARAAQNPDSLRAILKLLPEQDRIEAVKRQLRLPVDDN